MLKKVVSILIALVLMLAMAACVKTPGGDDPIIVDPPVEEPIVKRDNAIDRNGKLVDYVAMVGQATGADALKGSTIPLGIGGTDLGIPFYSSLENRLYFCFGDSYTGPATGNKWNSNAILYTDSFDFVSGVGFSGKVQGIATSKNGIGDELHTQITPDAHLAANYPDKVTRAFHPRTELNLEGAITSTSTTIPTGAIEVNGNYYMFYMEVTGENFGDNGQWCIHSNRVMRSTDKGKTWSQFAPLKWDYASAPNFGQIFPMEADGYIYIYGIPGGRTGSVKMGRVLKADFEDMSKYEYFTGRAGGEPKFVKGQDGLDTVKVDKTEESTVIPGPCGEISMIFNEYTGTYVCTYQKGNTIVIRQSAQPYGPFTNPETVFVDGDFGLAGIYGAFTNTKFVTNQGKRMFFMTSVWFPVYNSYQMEIVLK